MNDYIDKWNRIAEDLVKWKSGHLDSSYGQAYADMSIEAIVDYIGDCTDLKILDLGCGDGLLGCHFADKASVFGIDSSSVLINMGISKHPNINFKIGDITQLLPYPSNSFDVVTSNMVFMSMPSISTAFLESFRVLKTNGRFIFSVIHPCFSGKGWEFIPPNSIKIEYDKQYIKSFSFEKYLDSMFKEPITTFHRPIQNYINELLKSGFTLTGFIEKSIPFPSSSNEDSISKNIKNYLVANSLIIHGCKNNKE